MKKVNIFDRIQNTLAPVGNFLGSEIHFASIQNGLMSIVGITLIGAIFQIIATPPVNQQLLDQGGFWLLFKGWFDFAQAHSQQILLPYNMTMGMFSIAAVFSIGYQLAKKRDLPAMMNGLMALLIFLMIAAPVTLIPTESGYSISMINTQFLGGTGLFTAILVALVTVDISYLCNKYNIKIRLSESVPAFLQESFSAIIPFLVNIIVFYGLSLLSQSMTGELIPQFIMTLLAKPLTAVNSIPGVLIIIFITTLLWSIGLHGTSIVYPIIFPLMIQVTTENAIAVASGGNAVFSPIMLFGAAAMIGGTGNTFALALLASRAKSKQLKAVGNAAIIPGVFQVNEPLIFGLPIVFNPILAIPFVFGPVLFAFILWLCYSIGLLDPGYVLITSALPLGVASFLGAMSVKNMLMELIVFLPLTGLLWYPFVKAYDRQLLKEEQEQNIEGDL